MLWYFKQLFPLTYWTNYKTSTGTPQFAIWRMWFGKCFNVAHVPVAE